MATVLEQVQEKYELLGKIKEGGMGAIYKVRHKLLGEERVVKIMRPQLEGDQEFAVRFVREAQTLIRVRHPNIAQLYDFFADEAGNAAMVMEYIPGIDLRELLRRHGPPSLGLAVEVAFQSLEAIGFLHRRNMVHRDISPDNLMLCRDADGKPLVKLIDLGIVKVLEAEATGLTSTGRWSQRGPPTAPKRTASASRQSRKVASGSGSPVRSMAAPPTSPSLSLSFKPAFSATLSRTRTAAAVTSGPMPSPGSTAILSKVGLRFRVCRWGRFGRRPRSWR
uniref:Serine/threonine protein kinase n=1 Tax=Thermoanaerobaculum aquaticum TaxID=1312852 RepID=A0A7V1ZIF4_9BACT